MHLSICSEKFHGRAKFSVSKTEGAEVEWRLTEAWKSIKLSGKCLRAEVLPWRNKNSRGAWLAMVC
jgi:hypothetical protein